MHAVCGCDTTSHLFGPGKGAALKKIQTEFIFREQARIFCDGASATRVEEGGETAIVSLHGGRLDETLDSLHCRKFAKKVANCNTSPGSNTPSHIRCCLLPFVLLAIILSSGPDVVGKR